MQAAALVFDVSITLTSGQRSEAIQLCIEHEDDYSVEVFIPYQLTDNGVLYGEIFAQEGPKAKALRLFI